MEFNKKLQELRKQKGLSQEELAKELYVSRTAISKWESGRGYPNIDSLKAISKFFEITIDELLSSEELLSLAEQSTKQKENHFLDLIFGLLDISILMLFFLPLFAQKTNTTIQEVSLLSLTQTAVYLKIAYYIIISINIIFGISTLALQNYNLAFWIKNKRNISLILNVIAALLFIISLQPYAAVLLFTFLIIKVLLLVKKQ